MTDKPTQSEGLNRTWGTGSGLLIDPDTITPGKVALGWLVAKPAVEFMNWLQHFVTKFANHVNEEGIPKWDAVTPYPENAYTKGSNGSLYRSNQATTGDDPTTEAEWDLFQTPITTIKGSDQSVVFGASQTDDDFIPTLDANSRYHIKFYLTWTGVTLPGTGNYSMTFSGPAGSTVSAQVTIPNTTSFTSGGVNTTAGVMPLGSSMLLGQHTPTLTATYVLLVECVVVTDVTSGVFSPSYAAGSTIAGEYTIGEDSYMELTKTG